VATFIMVSRRVKTIALVATLACLLPSCSSSRYEFASNKRLGVYLKVPKTWRHVSQDDLFPLYAQGEKQPSPEAFQILKQLMWERAWDSSKTKDINHFVLGNAKAPTVRVSVRALTADQQQTTSSETLSNLILGAYSDNLKGFKELLRNPGTSDLVSADFVPIQDDVLKPGPKSNIRDGFTGVRQLFEARNTDDQSLYMIGFIGILNDAHTRLYSMTVHCNRNCYAANESSIQKVLDSFTVRKPPT